MISDNRKVSLDHVDCSPCTRRNALNVYHHKKRMNVLDYIPVELSYLETVAKTFVIPARQNQFIQRNIFNNALVHRIAFVMRTNSAFIESYIENPFW